ncbi:relaxase/mobilization nuclease domain-containing protein [Desulfovibrio sp. OttesenSCG-928-I05]|nr:relaxase/mobilization nuclease domain-containing protein [Desulfovibrio sp. OttesenSCG-928-I05]
MISKHVHYEAAHDNYGALARYIADAGHKGEKCLASWCAGCAADDDYELAIIEAQAVQSMNTRSQKEKTYHLLVSFRPEDEARLTPEAFKAIEERFAAALGFSEHQRHCGIHKNTNNIHMHVSYSMIHPERLTRREPFRDYATRDKLCRELEKEYGLTVDNGREQRQENALSHKAAAIETHTGQESFESYAKRHKGKIIDALGSATHWQDLHEALKSHGLGIKPHGAGLVIVDLHDKHTAKASAVDRSLSAKRLQERFGAFQPYRSLRPVQEFSRYQAVPLHRSPERGKLFARFTTGIETRKTKLESIKEREDKQLAAIREEWAVKRREIEKMSIGKRNRHNLLTLARKHEKEAIAKIKLALLPERESVRQEISYTSWQGFLKLEAENGNEVALAVLRSRNESVEPETVEQHEQTLKSPVKDWSRHGLDYAAKTAIRAEYAEKERELQERPDLSARSKKELLAFLRMEQIAAEARAEGSDLGTIKRRIDGKGIVIFTLDSGATIRDTGKKIFYSAHDSKAEDTARLYAEKKWGKRLTLEKGCIRFQPELELPKRRQEISR